MKKQAMQVFHALYLSRRPAVAFVIVGLFWGCFAAYVPQIKARLDVSDATFGLLLLCNALGLVSSMVLAPRLDRLLGARGMQIGSVALTISFLLPGFATDALSFGLAMVIVGAASGFTDVLMNARVSELEQLHSKPLMNANHGMFSVGYAVAAILSGVAREAQIAPGPAFATLAASDFDPIDLSLHAPSICSFWRRHGRSLPAKANYFMRIDRFGCLYDRSDRRDLVCLAH